MELKGEPLSVNGFDWLDIIDKELDNVEFLTECKDVPWDAKFSRSDACATLCTIKNILSSRKKGLYKHSIEFVRLEEVFEKAEQLHNKYIKKLKEEFPY